MEGILSLSSISHPTANNRGCGGSERQFSTPRTERQLDRIKQKYDKKSIIPIHNQDNLCCARAIVTMRAWYHRNDRHHMPKNEWKTLSQGRPLQGIMARQLHRDAGVPEGPCGLPELNRRVENQACMGVKVLSFKTGPITFKDSPCFLSYYDGCITITGR